MGTGQAQSNDTAPHQSHQSSQDVHLGVGVARSAMSNIDSKGSGDPLLVRDKRWMMRYNELLQFHKKYGHCRVPHGHVENRKLSWWVMNQRAQFQLWKQRKKNWLSEERIALLNAIGFDWSPISRDRTQEEKRSKT